TVSVSGPCPEDALVGDEFERVIEGDDDTAHVIDVLLFAAVCPIRSGEDYGCSFRRSFGPLGA
ncbi:MAG: hypothetical protein KBO60_26930, partial [Achromobacter sp.]|nr:hypothetical protein [Achromobacter sp.]